MHDTLDRLLEATPEHVYVIRCDCGCGAVATFDTPAKHCLIVAFETSEMASAAIERKTRRVPGTREMVVAMVAFGCLPEVAELNGCEGVLYCDRERGYRTWPL